MSARIPIVVTALAVFACAACERQPESPFIMLQGPTPAPSAELPRYWQIPDFALTERSGEQITPADLRGKVWVADFFYTTCPGPCPMMTSRLSEVHKALSSEPDARVVSISLDPAKDTPEVLQAYAKDFDASDRWLFLTGDKAEIYALALKGFKLSVAEDPAAAEPITHSTKLVLVDQTGTVRGLYEGVGEDDTQQLLADIRRLLREKS